MKHHSCSLRRPASSLFKLPRVVRILSAPLTFRVLLVFVGVSFILAAFGIGTRANAQQISAVTQTQIEALLAEKAARTPAQQKMDSQLVYFAKQNRGEVYAAAAPKHRPNLKVYEQNRVLVDLTAEVTSDLLDAITKGGGVVLSQFPKMRAIRAYMPIELVEPLASRADVRWIRPADECANSLGTVTTEGDTTHLAAAARTTFGADGAGVKIGVLSDGVNSLAASVANGNLHTVTVLSGQAGSGDEGTAMLEIVQDISQTDPTSGPDGGLVLPGVDEGQ